jgi:hypothetical protein
VPTSPLRTMLALSAATRAVVAEPELRPAVLALQREACRLTGACDATLIALDRTRGTLWTRDDSAMSDEVSRLVGEVAATGQRAVLGHALLEPIGGPPACAVLVLRHRASQGFATDDLALVGALVGGVATALSRLIERSFRHPAWHPTRPSLRASLRARR